MVGYGVAVAVPREGGGERVVERGRAVSEGGPELAVVVRILRRVTEHVLVAEIAAEALDGCGTLLSDDNVILARTPDIRGTVGMRMAPSADGPSGRQNQAGTGREEWAAFAPIWAIAGVKPGIFQGNRSLRGQHVQHGNPVRRKDTRRQVVLEIKYSDKLLLLDDGKAQDRSRAL